MHLKELACSVMGQHGAMDQLSVFLVLMVVLHVPIQQEPVKYVNEDMDSISRPVPAQNVEQTVGVVASHHASIALLAQPAIRAMESALNVRVGLAWIYFKELVHNVLMSISALDWDLASIVQLEVGVVCNVDQEGSVNNAFQGLNSIHQQVLALNVNSTGSAVMEQGNVINAMGARTVSQQVANVLNAVLDVELT